MLIKDQSNVYRDLAEKRVKPHYAEAQICEVSLFNEGCLITDFEVIEYQAISMEAAKNHWKVPFSLDTFQAYCNTIVASRVAWTLNAMDHVIVYPTDDIIVPGLLDTICKQIGVCTNTKLGVTLKPQLVTGVKLLSKDEMEQVSFFLRSLDNYIGAEGYVRDKSGVYDFMTMQLIDNQVKNPTMDPHPVYSLLASIIGPKLIASVLTPMVVYGDSDIYRSLLWQLTSC